MGAIGLTRNAHRAHGVLLRGFRAAGGGIGFIAPMGRSYRARLR